jgi:hypothetical protein
MHMINGQKYGVVRGVQPTCKSCASFELPEGHADSAGQLVLALWFVDAAEVSDKALQHSGVAVCLALQNPGCKSCSGLHRNVPLPLVTSQCHAFAHWQLEEV